MPLEEAVWCNWIVILLMDLHHECGFESCAQLSRQKCENDRCLKRDPLLCSRCRLGFRGKHSISWIRILTWGPVCIGESHNPVFSGPAYKTGHFWGCFSSMDWKMYYHRQYPRQGECILDIFYSNSSMPGISTNGDVHWRECWYSLGPKWGPVRPYFNMVFKNLWGVFQVESMDWHIFNKIVSTLVNLALAYSIRSPLWFIFASRVWSTSGNNG